VARASATTQSAYETSLLVASVGRHVLPCCGIREDGSPTCKSGEGCDSPGKHPLINRGGRSATTRIDVINGWNQKWPDCNWAWVPNRSGFVVLDVDNRTGGDEDLIEFEREHGPLPDTERTITSDGFHAAYRLSDGGRISGRKLSRGIELKAGASGYVMLPGSRHPSGKIYTYEVGFEFQAIEVALLPEWLLVQASEASGGSSEEYDRFLSGVDLHTTTVDQERLQSHLGDGTHLSKIWRRDLQLVIDDDSPSAWEFKLFLELQRLGYELREAHPVVVAFRKKYGNPTEKLYNRLYVGRTWSKCIEYAQNGSRGGVSPLRAYQRESAIVQSFRLRHEVMEKGGTLSCVIALQCLAGYTKDGVCHMSIDRLSSELPISRSQAGKILQWLAAEGYISPMSSPERGWATVWNLRWLS
jgi:hypothetical protein